MADTRGTAAGVATCTIIARGRGGDASAKRLPLVQDDVVVGEWVSECVSK